MNRAELRLICKELDIDDTELTIEEMKDEIKKIFDQIYDKTKKRRIRLGEKQFSETLIKFVIQEYQYILKNKEGKELDYNFNKKEE